MESISTSYGATNEYKSREITFGSFSLPDLGLKIWSTTPLHIQPLVDNNEVTLVKHWVYITGPGITQSFAMWYLTTLNFYGSRNGAGTGPREYICICKGPSCESVDGSNNCSLLPFTKFAQHQYQAGSWILQFPIFLHTLHTSFNAKVFWQCGCFMKLLPWNFMYHVLNHSFQCVDWPNYSRSWDVHSSKTNRNHALGVLQLCVEALPGFQKLICKIPIPVSTYTIKVSPKFAIVESMNSTKDFCWKVLKFSDQS